MRKLLMAAGGILVLAGAFLLGQHLRHGDPSGQAMLPAPPPVAPSSGGSAAPPVAAGTPQAPPPAPEPPPLPSAPAVAATTVAPPPAEAPPAPARPPAVPPSFDHVRVSPRGEMVLAGRAEPESEVTILYGTETLGVVRADLRGEWVFVPARPVTGGSTQLSLRAKARDGTVTDGSNPVLVLLPVPEPPQVQTAALPPPASAPPLPPPPSAASPPSVPGAAATQPVEAAPRPSPAAPPTAAPQEAASSAPVDLPAPTASASTTGPPIAAAPAPGSATAPIAAAPSVPPAPIVVELPREAGAIPRVLQAPSLPPLPEPVSPAPLPPVAAAPAPSPAALPPAPGAAIPPSRGPVSLQVVDYDERGEVRFAGTATPNAPVRVYVNNDPVGEATAGADGRWSVSPAAPVAPGVHQLRVDQLMPSGQVAQRVEAPFQRVEIPPEAMRDGQVVVQPGHNLWRIARSVYGRGIHHTVIYQANREQIRNPHLIYPGQVFTLPAQN